MAKKNDVKVMVTIDRVTSDYTVFYTTSSGLWEGRCNKCGGTDASSNATLATVMASVITLLSSGGSIFLKGAALPVGLTYGSTIIIVVDYQGTRKTYSNNALVAAEGAGLQGTATIVAGTTSILVSHSLGAVPKVLLTLQSDIGGYSVFSPVATRSTSQFYIHIGSMMMENVLVDWKVFP